MKRIVFLYSLMFICLASSGIATEQSNAPSEARPDARPGARKACSFSITGVWRSDATNQMNPIYFSFSPEGFVTLLGHSADTLPQDFEMITAVNYKLDKPAAPKRLEFMTNRGNDIFPAGMTLLKIVEYTDDSFTAIDITTGQKSQWAREQTHRYFLTFAARNNQLQPGGSVFVMLTALDGRKTDIEALGVQLIKDDSGKTVPLFGQIPAELYNQIIVESEKDKKSNKDEIVIMRFELTQAEFETTLKTYQIWDKYVKTQALPHSDPYLNAMEFLRKTAEGLNQCGNKVKLHRVTQREQDEIVSKFNPIQQPLEYIRVMRKTNSELHINNAVYPWGWRPVLQLPVQ